MEEKIFRAFKSDWKEKNTFKVFYLSRGVSCISWHSKLSVPSCECLTFFCGFAIFCLFFFTDRPQPTNTLNSVVVPQWKKELAERRKNRPETINGVQMSNKENEPKTSPEIPQWKKEIVERRKRRETSPIRVRDKIDRSPQTPEWKQRLSNNRRTQPIVIPRGPSEDSGDQVPSFMKEFEKKKRTFPRGNEMNLKPVPFPASRRSNLSVLILRRRSN